MKKIYVRTHVILEDGGEALGWCDVRPDPTEHDLMFAYRVAVQKAEEAIKEERAAV